MQLLQLSNFRYLRLDMMKILDVFLKPPPPSRHFYAMTSYVTPDIAGSRDGHTKQHQIKPLIAYYSVIRVELVRIHVA